MRHEYLFEIHDICLEWYFMIIVMLAIGVWTLYWLLVAIPLGCITWIRRMCGF